MRDAEDLERAIASEEAHLQALAKDQFSSLRRVLESLRRLQDVELPALDVERQELNDQPEGMVQKKFVVKKTKQPLLIAMDEPTAEHLQGRPKDFEHFGNSMTSDMSEEANLVGEVFSSPPDRHELGARGDGCAGGSSLQTQSYHLSMTSQDRGSPTSFSGAIKTQATVEALLNDTTTDDAQVMLNRLKSALDYIAGILVLMNSLVLLVQFEMEGRIVGESVGLSDGPAWAELVPILQIVDIVFVFVFLIEWMVRIAVERRAFVHDYANLFDTVLVLGGLVDMYISLVFVGDSTASKSIVILRLMRAMKSFRAIRMVRSLRFFRGLRVLVKACQCFLPSLCWSMVLLLIFMAMGALMLGNLLQSFVDDDTADLDDRQWIWMHYGTAYRALYTLFEITFAGNWPTNTRPVLEKVSHGFVIFFICYITLVVFAIIRVISAVFLKDTLDAAQNDAEALVVDKLHKRAEFVNKLEVIFRAIDDSGTGILSEERLTNILSNPKVAAYFQTMDLDVHEGKALFHVMSAGADGISLDEFIDGILKCKGPARAIDQVAMHAELKNLDTKLTRLVRNLDSARVITASRSFVDSGNAKSMAEHLKVFRMDDRRTSLRK